MTIPIIISLWAFLFSQVLIQPSEVFAWWPGTVRFLTTGTTRLKEVSQFQEGLQKILYQCAKCGAFWWWALYFHFFETGTKYFVLGGIVCVFSAWAIDVTWNRINR